MQYTEENEGHSLTQFLEDEVQLLTPVTLDLGPHHTPLP